MPTRTWLPSPDVVAAGLRQRARYDGAPAWTGREVCAGGQTAGARALAAYLQQHFEGILSVGGYNCRVNTANASAASVHATGRALDVMVPNADGPTVGALGDRIGAWLVEHATEIGVQYIIWTRVSWNPNRSDPQFRPYTGPSPHVDHLHVELNEDAAAQRTPWFSDGINRAPESAVPGSSKALGVFAVLTGFAILGYGWARRR
jgi:hypothetical protein